MLVSSLALTIPAKAAHATFHVVMIDEVHTGSVAQPQSSYVELEMYAPEQNFVGDHAVIIYAANGDLVGEFAFPADLPGLGVTQQTMLVGDDGVEAAFGVKPDLISSTFNLAATGGAACWSGIDCMSWGNFKGNAPSPSGFPADPTGIPDGSALTRPISGGSCSNLLDEQDDTNSSDEDFIDAAPSPQSYATVPAAPSCAATLPTPVTTIDSMPASFANSADASFAFHADPVASDFECRLDLGPYVGCDSGTALYSGPLSEGFHTFRVRGLSANGTGATTLYSWTVDLTPPIVKITTHPIDPSRGNSTSFRYTSNESGSKFECRLSPLETSFTPCETQPKAYPGLADGGYKFEVRAADPAGNLSEPESFAWTVDHSLADKTPPETIILSRPPDPNTSSTASFAYSSDEPGSSFECKLDDGNFDSCPASGITYDGLGNGSHTFQVRAIDTSQNVDLTPAGYSFAVVLPDAVLQSAFAGPAPVPATPGGTNTTITKQGNRPHDRTPTFRFDSNEAPASFQCKLDDGPFKACRSPFTARKLSYGFHILQIRAIAAGIADPSPARANFKVVRA